MLTVSIQNIKGKKFIMNIFFNRCTIKNKFRVKKTHNEEDIEDIIEMLEDSIPGDFGYVVECLTSQVASPAIWIFETWQDRSDQFGYIS